MPTKSYLLASVAGETLWVVGVSQCSDHSPFNILPTCLALCTKLHVVVMAAVVVVILHEVASRGQQAAAHYIVGRCYIDHRLVTHGVTQTGGVIHTRGWYA